MPQIHEVVDAITSEIVRAKRMAHHAACEESTLYQQNPLLMHFPICYPTRMEATVDLSFMITGMHIQPVQPEGWDDPDASCERILEQSGNSITHALQRALDAALDKASNLPEACQWRTYLAHRLRCATLVTRLQSALQYYFDTHLGRFIACGDDQAVNTLRHHLAEIVDGVLCDVAMPIGTDLLASLRQEARHTINAALETMRQALRQAAQRLQVQVEIQTESLRHVSPDHISSMTLRIVV